MVKRVLGILAGLSLAACGSNECRLDAPDSCGGGLVCEAVQGQETGRCFAPVQLKGKVFSLESKQALSGAQVTALDENGASLSDVAVTDAQGAFTLRVPSVRTDEKGTFVPRKVTLRAAAEDHVPFPAGVRPSLPIDTGTATREKENAPAIVQGPLTEVGLQPLPQDQRGLATVTGKLSPAPLKGALVIAEATVNGTLRSVTAPVDRAGNFTLYNVPAGEWTVAAYGRGINYSRPAVTVASQDVKDVVLEENKEGALATVSGSVSIVAASGATSVVMVPESTFNEVLGRGEVPPGLRAPETGAPSVTGGFTIEGVPDGRYVVLAGFENDGLVRDPDPTISGTTIQRLTIVNGAPVGELAQFKVTGAISLVAPGAGETVEVVSATPTFQWNPYSSAKLYDLKVISSLGELVWSQTGIVAVTGGVNSVTYAGPALTPGGVYQWRLQANDRDGLATSSSEILKGVFQVQAQ